MTDVLDILTRLEKLLMKYKVISSPFLQLRDLYEQDKEAFWDKINSLVWWGGSGSYADIILKATGQITAKEELEDNRAYRRAMIDLANAMEQSGISNEGANFIAETFQKWEEEGI